MQDNNIELNNDVVCHIFLWNERYKNSHLYGKECETPQKMHSVWKPRTAISQTFILSEQTYLESKKSKQLFVPFEILSFVLQMTNSSKVHIVYFYNS